MENVLVEKSKEKLNSLKMWADELELQMALGKAEARDAFERERKNITKFVNSHKSQIKMQGKISTDKKQELLVFIEKLEESLNQNVPTNKRDYNKYKKEVLYNIYNLEYALKDSYGELDLSLKNEFDEFKTKLDVFRINLALNDSSDKEKVDSLKAKVQEKIFEIRTKMQKSESELNRMDNFMEDISESFDYFKKAINDLLD